MVLNILNKNKNKNKTQIIKILKINYCRLGSYLLIFSFFLHFNYLWIIRLSVRNIYQIKLQIKYLLMSRNKM